MDGCDCQECRIMCRRPCWPTPDEAFELIAAGYAQNMMYDYWARIEGDIGVIAPALKGREGDHAPFMPYSEDGCTFWHNGLCQLHDRGLKPLEGRMTYACRENEDGFDREQLVALWDTDDGRAVVELWWEVIGHE